MQLTYDRHMHKSLYSSKICKYYLLHCYLVIDIICINALYPLGTVVESFSYENFISCSTHTHTHTSEVIVRLKKVFREKMLSLVVKSCKRFDCL